ncbi:citrate lyase acyl carrier protein [Caloramator sp. E03]|uniref:citrate lyase acyl carrier protein n=1 Tax=Caloramator sp. E03 TaxID=2576307 RepID=UPI00111027C6|nr:citrate lyase acyl carrier protein [Caloramator sp. E03]QCX33051.1 citrate lyase acyl carrier protein [Caloramator sp. E03]
MEIKKSAKAGTFESNDIYVMVQPNDKRTIEINLESIVKKQFGKQIEKVIMDTLKELGVKSVIITAKDRGALDYTIKSRIETAIRRAL